MYKFIRTAGVGERLVWGCTCIGLVACNIDKMNRAEMSRADLSRFLS